MSAESFANSTDGIRGPAGVHPLNPGGLYRIGMAVGTAAAEMGRSSVVIGEDTRQSSKWMADAVAEGVAYAGLIAVRLGVIPTPGTAVIARELEQMGIQITASHNPAEDNGVKPITPEGGKISDELAVWLDEHRSKPVPTKRPNGNTHDARHWLVHYENFLLDSGNGAGSRLLEGKTIALGTAHGAASGIAGRIFARGRGLGADVIELGHNPDGLNINDGYGATHMETLQAWVVRYGAEAGFAFDGDADRVLAVDEHGRVLTGDHLLGILALTDPATKSVVGTTMTNSGLEATLKMRGIQLHRSAVGDRFVVEKMQQEDSSYGAEGSGHVLMPGLPTGDGMRTAIEIMKRAKADGRSLADFYDALPMYPQELGKIPIADKEIIRHPIVQAACAEIEAEIGDSGRFNSRPSGTEPVVRVMIEAQDAHARMPIALGKISRAIGEAMANPV